MVPAVPVDGFTLRASAPPPFTGGFVFSALAKLQVVPLMPSDRLPPRTFQKQLPSRYLVFFLEIHRLIVGVLITHVGAFDE